MPSLHVIPRSLLVITALSLLTLTARSQSPTSQFDVASVKSKPKAPANPDAGPRPPFPFSPLEAVEDKITTSPLTLTMRDVTLHACIKWAYGVQDSQVFGPDWLTVDRFDITAKAPSPVPVAQLRLMLQSLLADRFQLTLHHDSRTISGYAMVVGKDGPKLTASDTEGGPEIHGRLRIEAHRYTMENLAVLLSKSLEAYVADQTGMKGPFDFTIDITKFFSVDTPVLRTESTAVMASAFDRALQQQLGLKLVARKAPAEVLVIDHAGKPTGN